MSKLNAKSSGSPVVSKTPGANRTERHWKRKNIVIDQRKLDLAKSLLQAPTETAAIDQALDLVAFQKEVLAGVDRMVSMGGIDDLFEDR